MNEQQLTWLENRLEQLVEGAFASLFGKSISTRDIALAITRSMEDGTHNQLAPDAYIIYLHPDIVSNLANNHTDIESSLSQHVLDLANIFGYSIQHQPTVSIQQLPKIRKDQIIIETNHSSDVPQSTRAIPATTNKKPKTTNPPQLIMSSGQSISLEKPIINIGRSDENDIIIDDPFLSRHHIQLRQQQGGYLLFDVKSRGGTKVNDIIVNQHLLHSGDVILIGHTKLIYFEKDNSTHDGTTQKMPSVD